MLGMMIVIPLNNGSYQFLDEALVDVFESWARASPDNVTERPFCVPV